MQRSQPKTAAELQAMLDRWREEDTALYGAPPVTIDALMLALREKGEDALNLPYVYTWIAMLLPKQAREVQDRLTAMRPRYPAITDEVLRALRPRADRAR